MAKKGDISKSKLTEAILGLYPNDAFAEGKNIYINFIENGDKVQLKLSIVMPTTPVGAPVKMDFETDWEFDGPTATPAPPQKQTEITQSERDNIAALMEKLGL